MSLTAGTILDSGKYVFDTQLSQGVFCITYRATDTESGQTVVIKTLGESLRQHPDFDRFKRQFLEFGDRLIRCKHPNLVQVLRCFEEAGRPYLVMEYIPGQTLAELVQSNGLSPGKAIKYIRQIGDALSALHKAGLVHRDVKPQNIIRRPDTDSAVLCEFGIACEFAPGVMQTHASLLSAGYAPLEQYAYEAQRTPATDIYALTATFYYLLTGQSPLPAPVRQTLYAGGGVSAVAPQEDRLLPPDLQQGLLKLNPVLKQAIGHGLELDAERRPQTLAAWLSMLPKPKKRPTTQPAANQRATAKASPLQKSIQANGKPVQKTREKPPAAEKNLLSQPALAQHLVQANGKSTPKTRATPQLPTLAKNQKPQLDLVKHLVTPLKGQSKVKDAVLAKLKISQVGLPLQALLMTGAIAASAGVGFGFALRINRPDEPGSTILHTKQSFPPRSDWPVSEPRL